jgi:acetyl-CoA acetyltransferase
MNPKSAYQKEVSLEEVLASRVIADPLRLLECCPNTDGCAAVILAAKDVVDRFSGDPVWLAGCGQASGTYTGKGEFFMSQLIQDSAREAYEMAGLGPEDIDMAEVHDCFSMAEITHYEDLDFCRRGEGGRLVEDRVTWLGGKLPVNPSGGLLCKGHPLGATGPGQIYEIVKQLQNGGGFRHCDGGCSIVSILKK